MRVPVAALYRVSTTKQLKKDEEESIPVQAKAVRDYVARHPDWDLVCEYKEEGVSAYKWSKDERDILQQAIADAIHGKFRVLLVFKADRLSRNSFEYPIMLWQLCQAGVEVISVVDGKSLKIEDQTDKLVRFIEGWQAETESKNTSIRVYHAMKALAEKGRWSGGRPPYGFRLSEKKGGLPLEIDEAEAAIIREMCKLYLEEHMGSKAIAGLLNARGVRTREGRPWRDNRVRAVLQNPIIAGLPAFGRTVHKPGRKSMARVSDVTDLAQYVVPRDEQGNPKPIPEYSIIDLDTWYALCKRMKANRPNHDGNVLGISRSDALLSGFLVCGYCGRSLVSSSQKCQWHRSKRYMTPKRQYRCVTHIRVGNGREFCPGQRSYSQKKIDQVFLNELRTFLSSIKVEGLESYVKHRHASQLIDASRAVAKLEADLKKAEKVRMAWVERLDAYFAKGEGLYSEELLAAKVQEYDRLVKQLKAEIETAKAEARAERERRTNILEFCRKAPEWLSLFEQAPVPTKKKLLASIIEKVVVFKDKIEIHYCVDLAEFVGSETAEMPPLRLKVLSAL